MQWYQLSKDEVLNQLSVNDRLGLSGGEVLERQQKYGRNEIIFKKTPAWVRFIRQFKDPMVIILLITASITGILTVLGMLPDTIVILSVVLLNAILGFVQEGKAEGALDALRSMMVPECMVMRDGNITRIPSGDLVPGDIVVLEGGDKIPADILVQSEEEIQTKNEITGHIVRQVFKEGIALLTKKQSTLSNSG